MDNLNKFVTDNYILVICISLFIMFTLIGYLSDLVKTAKIKSKDKMKEIISHPDLKEKKSMGIADIVKADPNKKENIGNPISVEDSFVIPSVMQSPNAEIKTDEPVNDMFNSSDSVSVADEFPVEEITSEPVEEVNTMFPAPESGVPEVQEVIDELPIQEVNLVDSEIKDELPTEENKEALDPYTIKKFD